MPARALLVLLASLARAQIEPTETEPICDFSVKNLTTNQPVNLTQFCKDRACIVKCCPENEILFKNASLVSRLCVNVNDLETEFGVKSLNDYSSLDIYNKDIKEQVIKTEKTVNDLIQLQYINYKEFVANCSEYILPLVRAFSYAQLYILEDGALRIRRFNYIDDWFVHYTEGQFCYDRFMYAEKDHTVDPFAPRFIFLGIPESEAKSDKKNGPMLTASGMVVSCVFLALVLVVYALLRPLRNLPGLMLMAYATTMLAFFLLRAVLVFGNKYYLLNAHDCHVMTILVYYTMISCFSWMNVMSFDIWWTLRGMRKQTEIHGRGVVVKFLWYCGYAWGAPLAPVAFVVIVDHLDLTHIPAFIKPHVFEGDCFFDRDSILLYLILPLGLMVCANVILFLLTAYNIWLVRRGVNRSSNTSKAEYRCAVYVKLFLVMGVNWIVEVVSSMVAVESEVWYISDVLNGLVGLFIFVMFVCKRRIILDLCSLFSIDGAWVRRLRARGGAGEADSAGTRTRSTARNGSTDESGVDMHPEPILN